MGLGEGVAKIVGHRRVDYFSVDHVQSFEERGVVEHGLSAAAVHQGPHTGGDPLDAQGGAHFRGVQT